MTLSGGGRFARSVPVDQKFLNVGQNTIEITEDKLRNILRDYTDVLAGKEPLLSVFGNLVTLIIAFVTSQPKDFLLSSDTWRTIFIIASVVVFVWFVCCLVRYAKFRQGPMSSIDGVIDRIKGVQP